MFNTEGGVPGADALAEKLLSIAQYVFVFAVGLLPIFFIPSQIPAPGYTKILFLTVGAFFSLILFAFSVLRRGTLRIGKAYPILGLWLFALVSLASALLSGDFKDSFWGTEISVHSVVFTFLLAMTATLAMFISTSKRMLMYFYLLLMGSGILLALFHVVRLIFGTNALTFGIFGGNLVLSPFFEWNSLAVFFGLLVILSMAALEQLSLRTQGRVLFFSVIVASLFMLAIINFTAVFVVLGLVSLVVVIYGLTRGKFGVARTMIQSTSQVSAASTVAALITLLVSVVFVIGGAEVGAAISSKTGVSYIEVRPSMQATMDTARQVYAHDAALGIGPNRFSDAWRQFRDPSINSTIFWNTEFQNGYGFTPTIFVTHGVIGGLVWLGFLLSFLWWGARTFFKIGESDRTWFFIALSSFVASCYLWGMTIIYVPGPVLLLLAAATTGIFFACRQTLLPETEIRIDVMRNQRWAFVSVAGVVIVVVVAVGSTYLIGRHYAANYEFRSALVAMAQGKDETTITNYLSSAFSKSQDDTFAAVLTQYESDRLLQLIQSGATDDDTKNKFQASLQTAVQAGRTAVSLDPTEPDDYGVLGRVYEIVLSLQLPDVYNMAAETMKKAQELDPKNPARFVSLAELELLNKNTKGARDYIAQAIGLKSNYTDAIFLLSQIDIADGNVSAAIDSTRAVASLDPQNPVRYFQLGVLQISDRRFADAAQSFEKAISLSPDYSNARYYLAFAYDGLNRHDDAKKQLEEVLKANPGNTDVEKLLADVNSGKSLIPAQAPVVATSTQQSPVPESSESSKDGKPVTSGKAPNTPLLSPVNTDTATSSGQ